MANSFDDPEKESDEELIAIKYRDIPSLASARSIITQQDHKNRA